MVELEAMGVAAFEDGRAATCLVLGGGFAPHWEAKCPAW